MGRYVIGVTGASGIILAHKSVRYLIHYGHDVDLILSQAACYTALEEMGKPYASPKAFLDSFGEQKKNITLHSNRDFGATVASGSYPTSGMLVIPCSMATLAALAMGLSDNLVRRAADVTLKEKRPLVVVPREAPLSNIHMENMLKLGQAGAIMVPPVPAWYSKPKSLEDVEDTIVGRCLDALGVEHECYKRWEGVAVLEPLTAS